MRKAISKEVGAGGRFDIFLVSGLLTLTLLMVMMMMMMMMMLMMMMMMMMMMIMMNHPQKRSSPV